MKDVKDVFYQMDCEQQIIGSMMLEPLKIIPLVSGLLNKDEFYNINYGFIYQAIIELYSNGDTVTLITVKDRLKKTHKKIEKELLPIHLADLYNNIPTTHEAVIRNYIGKIREAAMKRDLHSFSQEIQRKTEEGNPNLDIINLMREKIEILDTKIEFEEFKYDSEALINIQDELDNRIRRYEEGEKVTGLKTGFEHLDNLINGLQPGLYVLGSAPSQGKTTFCRQLADQIVINNQIPVVFVSYEQSKFELIIKSLSRLAGIDSLHLQKGNIKGEKILSNLTDKEDDYYKNYAPYLITIEAEAETTLDRVQAYAMRAMKEKGTDKCLIIVDYLQVIPCKDVFKEKRIKIDHILSELRRLARRLNCPIWLVSSFSRTAYKDEEKRPDITAFKESGNIEYTADVAILMDTQKKELDEQKRTVFFNIIKNRNGSRGKIDFTFNPAISTFEELGKSKLEEDYLY